MAFEFGNQPTPSRISTKRRLNDDNDGYEVKRVYDDDALRRSACDPTAAAPPQSQLPSITYASPDYRPPPPRQDETPLWLQPPPAPPTMLMDEDLETDEDDSHSLPTPSASSLLEHNKTTSERVFAPLPGQQHMHYRN